MDEERKEYLKENQQLHQENQQLYTAALAAFNVLAQQEPSQEIRCARQLLAAATGAWDVVIMPKNRRPPGGGEG